MIGAAGGARPAPPPQADPELAQARRQLADWETCPSGKTPAGRAKIQKYSAQVSELAARDQKSQLEAATQQAAARAATTAASTAGGAGSVSAGPAGKHPGAAGSSLGSRIDLYA